MDSPGSIVPLLSECERVIGEAIDHFRLAVRRSDIVLTIQSHGAKKNALGWFCAESWQNCKTPPVHEINLCAEALKTHDMGETLLHELAHAENQKRGIQDVSKDGRTHNKRFKSMAERLGLVVGERDPRVGYGVTDLGKDAKAFLKKCAFKRELFDLCRLEPGVKANKGSRLIKCECPRCGYVARVTRKWLTRGTPRCPCGPKMKEEGLVDFEKEDS